MSMVKNVQMKAHAYVHRWVDDWRNFVWL